MYHWIKTSSVTRYAVIGFSAFVLDLSLLNVGLRSGLALLVANGISVTIAIVYSFIMHRSFTFAHRANQSTYRHNVRYQAVIFVVISLTALLINEWLMHLFVNTAGWRPNPAKVITSAIVFVWNYVLNRSVTFTSEG